MKMCTLKRCQTTNDLLKRCAVCLAKCTMLETNTFLNMYWILISHCAVVTCYSSYWHILLQTKKKKSLSCMLLNFSYCSATRNSALWNITLLHSKLLCKELFSWIFKQLIYSGQWRGHFIAGLMSWLNPKVTLTASILPTQNAPLT